MLLGTLVRTERACQISRQLLVHEPQTFNFVKSLNTMKPRILESAALRVWKGDSGLDFVYVYINKYIHACYFVS